MKALSNAIKAVLLLFALLVCLYLTRLEAHTDADIILPLDYDTNVVGADSPEDYYYEYTRQESRPYTIRQDLLLSRLAYIDAPQGFRGETEGVTVKELCEEIVRTQGDETPKIIYDIGEHEILTELQICEYIHGGSGFAGYVLKNGDEITVALRGTDDIIDSLDNAILLPFNLSVQYAAMKEMLERYPDATRIWLTGHSKGGHNAIYAASVDARCRATGFNSPGFGIFLSDAQHDGLDYGVNYVINGDITGFLLFHLERRVVLESSESTPDGRLPFNYMHRLDNFFAVDDLAVASEIRPLSIFAEWITQLLWLLLVFIAILGAFALIRRFLRCFSSS